LKDIGRPAGHHREQAHSYSWIEYIWQELVGCPAAFASKLCSYKSTSKIKGSQPAAAPTQDERKLDKAFDLDPRATSEG
jgi:hypothetical protein